MLQRVSHHFPYLNEADVAFCGHRRQDGEVGSATPGCPACLEELEVLDRLDLEAEMPLFDPLRDVEAGQ